MANNFSRAFTFIELLVVMIVVAILFSIAYPVYTGTLERAKVTKDMNNLRQIGLATQTYMNDNDGVLPGSTTVSWMSQIYPKYLSSWYVLISPFDNPVSPRVASDNNANSALSYGINLNGFGIAADKITKPTVFIVFAPAQASGATVRFLGKADTTSQANLANSANLTVVGIDGAPPRATSNPPSENAIGGTHSRRIKINALFADWHAENMDWTTFTNNAATANDPDGNFRWTP